MLFQDSALDIGHVLVCLEHFGQEVVRARDRDPRLHQELHAFHYICSCGIIECDLTLDVVVYLELVGDIDKLFTVDSHVLREGHLALLTYQSLGVKSIVEVQLELAETLQHTLLIIDSPETELLLQVFLFILFSFYDLFIAIDV